VFGHDHGQPFLGREFRSEPDYSDEIAREIDALTLRMGSLTQQFGDCDPWDTGRRAGTIQV
jgi:hypothetical protein